LHDSIAISETLTDLGVKNRVAKWDFFKTVFCDFQKKTLFVQSFKNSIPQNPVNYHFSTAFIGKTIKRLAKAKCKKPINIHRIIDEIL
jgi:hypothetical protein